MKKTLEELKEIEHIEFLERRRAEMSAEHGFCPVCGSKLIKIKKKRWWDLSWIALCDQWWERNYCPLDVSHYDKKGTYFDASTLPAGF